MAPRRVADYVGKNAMSICMRSAGCTCTRSEYHFLAEINALLVILLFSLRKISALINLINGYVTRLVIRIDSRASETLIMLL